MATDEDKFQAAVNVVRAMPKKGPFQPSPELMLKFYAYFKQATEGPCLQPKPSFWEVIAKAKWEAWRKLDNMRKDEAMRLYVAEIKKIGDELLSSEKYSTVLETSASDPDIENLAEILLPFYRIVYGGEISSLPDPLQQLAVKYSPIVPVTKENETENEAKIKEIAENQATDTVTEVPEPEDVFEDAIPEIIPELIPLPVVHSVNEDILETLKRLEFDLLQVKSRIDLLETVKQNTVETRDTGTCPEKEDSVLNYSGLRYFPLLDLSFPTSVAILVWPFISFAIFNKIVKRNQVH